MRRVALLLSTLLVLGVLPASASVLDLPDTVLELPDGLDLRIDAAAANAVMSDNVEYVATIPFDSGVGGQLVDVVQQDGSIQRRFYATGASGLTILDVGNPALPTLIGKLVLPHHQNEEVAVSEDGSRVIISNDTVGVSPTTGDGGVGGVHVIDTSDPTAPVVSGFVASNNHTTMCADPACDWLYGSSGGIMAVAEDGSVSNTGLSWDPERVGGGGAHNLNRDDSGLLISDTDTRVLLDPADILGTGGTYEYPALVTIGQVGEDFSPDGLLQHNNVRPDALEWTPRAAGDAWTLGQPLRTGESFLGNSESNINPDCLDAGGLSVWAMADFDKGVEMTQLDIFRPFNGDYVSGGNPPANGLGCSGHWFTYADGLVAASWYEHGVKIFDVDMTGTRTDAEGDLDLISQVGFFNPIATQAGASHWITDVDSGEEYIYNVDYARGIDIVRFDRDATPPSANELNASWLANVGQVRPEAAAERYFCRLGTQ